MGTETKSKSLAEWLTHIESFHPAEIELGLGRIRAFAQQLELLDFNGKVVIVGGTNGKGSCVAMLESLALTHGLSVGVYTSPHLLKFNERIRLSGKEVGDSSLVSAFESIEMMRGDKPLTFFEFTTLAAFSIFKQAQPDLIILEVGLGGRLDAVNIAEPDLSIITTIALDHIDWLGDSLDKIAYEKAGIARSNKITLTGDKKSFALLKAQPVMQTAHLRLVDLTNQTTNQVVSDPQINTNRLLKQNVILAKEAFEHLFPHFTNKFKKAFQAIDIKGRFQLLDLPVKTIVDVAHNAQSATNLAEHIRAFKAANGLERVSAICGMMADKAIAEVLEIMDAVIDSWYFVDLKLPRASSASALANCYSQSELSKPVELAANVALAYQNCESQSQSNSMILVFGSFITVADMLQYQHAIQE